VFGAGGLGRDVGLGIPAETFGGAVSLCSVCASVELRRHSGVISMRDQDRVKEDLWAREVLIRLEE